MDSPTPAGRFEPRPGPPPPFFLVGSERSGTTLLRLMLDHHPTIAVPHEFEFAVTLVGDDGSLPEIGIYHSYLEGDNAFRRSGFSVLPNAPPEGISQGFEECLQGEHLGVQRTLMVGGKIDCEKGGAADL